MPIDVTHYSNFLTGKRKKSVLIDERVGFLNMLKDTLKQITASEVGEFIRQARKDGHTAMHNAYTFLADYTAFIEKEAPGLHPVLAAINEYCTKTFEDTACDIASRRKKAIIPIPKDTQVDPALLGELTNAAFVRGFDTLQKWLVNTYADIAAHPFEWGYPNFYVTDGYHNRITDILFAFVLCGTYENDALVVDAKKFWATAHVKRHTKVDLTIAGFNKIGLLVEGFSKKAEHFRIMYPENPHVIAVLEAYVQAANEIHPQWGVNPRNSLSYRFIQDRTAQAYEAEFLAAMDYASPKLYEIQLWLHAEATKHGFYIDKKEPCSGACILFKKKSKRFLMVYEAEKNGEKVVCARVVFDTVLTSEKDSEKVDALIKKFPSPFQRSTWCGNKDCNTRVAFNLNGKQRMYCRPHGFVFEDISLDDAKDILELYKIEYKIR